MFLMWDKLDYVRNYYKLSLADFNCLLLKSNVLFNFGIKFLRQKVLNDKAMLNYSPPLNIVWNGSFELLAGAIFVRCVVLRKVAHRLKIFFK